MKNLIKSTLLAAVIVSSAGASAATYVIDDEKAGAHSQIDVKVKHIGISWVKGRFNSFAGTFEYDKDKPNDSSVEVTINTQSFDSNHAKRDKHVTSDDFLNVHVHYKPPSFLRILIWYGVIPRQLSCIKILRSLAEPGRFYGKGIIIQEIHIKSRFSFRRW